MSELPEHLRRDLAQLSARRAPPPAAQQRVLAALELSAPGPDPADPDPDPDPPAQLDPQLAVQAAVHGKRAHLLWGVKVVAATLALTGTALLGLRGAVLGARSLRADPVVDALPTDNTTSETPPALRVAPTPRAPETKLPSEAPASHSLDASAEVQAPEPPRSSQHAPSTAASAQAPSPPPSDTLPAELALLDAARRASDPERVLEQLQAHEQRFPAGALALERKLLQIETLCALEQFPRARAYYEQLPRAGASPQRARLLELCPALSTAR